MSQYLVQQKPRKAVSVFHIQLSWNSHLNDLNRSDNNVVIKSLSALSQESEFLCLEFDEAKVNQMLKKMADIQESIDGIVHRP